MTKNLLQKGQFVDIEFTAKVKQSGEVFDTNIPEEANKANLPKEKLRPLAVCIGENMVPAGFDKALEGKEAGKEYTVELTPKEAFGERIPSMVKVIPLNVFTQKGIMPFPGLSLNMDGLIVRVSAVSGGRVITDFNNPLAGKNIIYTFKVKKVIEDKKQKLEHTVMFFLSQNPSEIIKSVDENKAILEIKHKLPKKMLDDLKSKISKITSLDVEIVNK